MILTAQCLHEILSSNFTKELNAFLKMYKRRTDVRTMSDSTAVYFDEVTIIVMQVSVLLQVSQQKKHDHGDDHNN